MLLCPEDVDRRLNWPLGRAAQMARRQKLPHLVLPDGSIRFRWSEVRGRLICVPASQTEVASCG